MEANTVTLKLSRYHQLLELENGDIGLLDRRFKILEAGFNSLKIVNINLEKENTKLKNSYDVLHKEYKKMQNDYFNVNKESAALLLKDAIRESKRPWWKFWR